MKMARFGVLVVAVLMAVASLLGRAVASDTGAVMAVINNAVASFNKGDEKTWDGLCTSSASIISNIPPYQYSTTCADWWSADAASDKKLGISGEVVTLAAAWHVLVTGDRAYAALPASFTYKQKGKTIKSSGNVLTVALQKTAAGWRMTGWSWAQH
jgi:hypothetical protein